MEGSAAWSWVVAYLGFTYLFPTINPSLYAYIDLASPIREGRVLLGGELAVLEPEMSSIFQGIGLCIY